MLSSFISFVKMVVYFFERIIFILIGHASSVSGELFTESNSAVPPRAFIPALHSIAHEVFLLP
jgi:hypothetical protein